MTTPASVLAELLTSLPPQYHQPVQLLAAATLQSDTPLRLTLVGAFSVGKSSLLNMLIGETLLPAALEETTALPTFIEYGSFRSLQQLQQDGTLIPLNDAAFTAAAIQAPEGAACAVVTLPLDWLHGISIIDLPGLGSLSATHRAYTLSQIRAADMVLYLIGSRGPSQDDIALLTEVHQAGKRVRLMVTQWDMIEAAVARGEKAPSLAQWATQIEAATGLKLQLEPCSRFGLGRETIQSFLHEAKKDTAAIRLGRFRAEVSPILHNALGQNSDSQRSCEAQSEDALRALHEQLMQRKQALIELKSGLYAQQREDRERIEQLCANPLHRERQTLAQNLQEQAGQINGEQDWDTFGEQGSGLLKTALAAVAGVFSQLSNEYGQLDLPEAQINAFNLRLPQPESVAAEDFLDIGQLTRLQQELARQQATFNKLEEKLSGLTVIDTYVEEQELFTLMQQRQALANQPLPCIIQEINTGNGGGVGRMIGDVLDVGLLFVNPATAATKVAAILGKGARVEKAVSITLKTVQALKRGEQVGMIPQSVMQKLGYLEVLSLAYWGEKIGTAIGGGTHRMEVIDPEALAQQQAELAGIEQQSHQLRLAISRNQDMANERELSGWALEQNQKEQVRLEDELRQLQTRAEQNYREAEQYQRELRQNQLKSYTERAINQWLSSFDQQTSGMMDLLRARVKSHWEDRVTVLVDERLREVDALNQQTRATTEEKQTTLTQLRSEALAIQAALEQLG